jgi:hypothetical protein
MSISNQFKGLPIEDLVATPLIAAARAQGKLAGVTTDFIQSVGMESDENGNPTKARTVDFNFKRPVNHADGTTTQEEASLSVPLLSIVNVPNLSITKTTVDFNMEVKQSSVETKQKEVSATVTASYKAWYSPVQASFSGSVSAKDSSTRKSDNSAKYAISVEAVDKGPPEGLMKVLDMLNASIQPIVKKPSTANDDDASITQT